MDRVVPGLLAAILIGCPASSSRDPAPPPTSPPASRDAGPGGVDAPLRVAFWNVRNLFHPDDTGEGKRSGVAETSDDRYRDKLARLARGLLVIGDGHPPALVALAEVGPAPALDDLAAHPVLDDADYRAVRLDGPDRRGIGNAVLTRLPAAAPPRHHVVHSTGARPTRAVLEARLRVGTRELVIFVNHWPSKRGGDAARAQRERVARRVARLVRHAAREDAAAEILVVGDFNAHLDERIFDAGFLDASAVEDRVALNAGGALLFHALDDAAEAAFGRSIDDLDTIRRLETRPGATFGTYVYRRRWATLDGILLHRSLLDARGLRYVPGSATITRDHSLIYVVNRGRPNAYEKPDRETSDHLPVSVELAAQSAESN